MANRITTGAVSRVIAHKYGGTEVPDWRIRRTLDAMAEAGTITMERVGQYRTISESDVPAVAVELQRLRCIPDSEGTTCTTRDQ